MQKIHWKYITLLLCRAKCTFSRCIGLCSSSIIRIQSNFANSIINQVKILIIRNQSIPSHKGTLAGTTWVLGGVLTDLERKKHVLNFVVTQVVCIFCHWINGTIIFLAFYKGTLQKLLSGFCSVKGGGDPPFLLSFFGHNHFPLRGRGDP